MVRLDALCITLPDPVVSSDSSTFHVCAAAVTNMVRPDAPTSRSGSQLVGVPVLPPAFWRPYLTSSSSACTSRTSFQSTSRSPAIILVNEVLMLCPIPGFFALRFILPSHPTFMNALGDDVPPWPA